LSKLAPQTTITPESVRRRVELIERCHELCPEPRGADAATV